MGDVGVSLSEIIEVRGCGLNDDELLALIIIACEVLSQVPAGLFSPEHIVLHTDGELEIKSVGRNEVSSRYVPPEILEGNTDVDYGAVHVFCLGEVLRFAGAAESNNADVFSLLNVMTVAHVATRPSITRLGQMAKNKLAIQNPKALLAEMYVLIMGDEADDIEDLDLSSGEYMPNMLIRKSNSKCFEWDEKIKLPQDVFSNVSTKGSHSDLYDSNKNDDMWTLSGGDPFSFIPADYDNSNSQRSGVNQQKLSLSKYDALVEQDEEDSSVSERITASKFHNFDDDIVEYKEENDDEKLIEARKIASNTDYNHLFTDVIPESNNSLSSLSPSTEVDEGRKKITVFSNSEIVAPALDLYQATDHQTLSNYQNEIKNVIISKENEPEPLPPSSILKSVTAADKESTDIFRDSDQQFVRRNSLLPDRISGRKSSRHLKRKLNRGPEFVKNASASSICLKAPAQRKKKVTLHRVEHTDVTVELLSGRHVEVSCRSDAVASEIADVVMRHLNFTENSFFGLTVLRDGEHFFLDGHQRLEKFAPPGWKNARQRGLSKRSYMLFLRFRYYPASLAFIRTEVVLHELYLQLRRDILDDRILPKRELLYTLAALAMQSEYSDQPNAKISDYFDAQYYIPKRYMDSRDKKAVIQDLVEKHGKYRGMKQIDAEKRFILLTQRLSDYGAHLYRVFTSKPSINLGNIPFGDPQTGVAQWIGIMARGIVIFEEESDGRHAQTEYLWQNTQTLQFDKKRFVIVSEIHEPSTNVFYTNHYSKSSYFVRFAASQHRFMIKMRQWNHTLRHDSPFQFHKVPDVGADTDLIKEVPSVDDSDISAPCSRSTFEIGSTEKDRFSSSRDSLRGYKTSCDRDFKLGDNYDDEISVDPLSENVDGYVLEISLKKDPSTGLGLTLVDGNLNGVKGVYVKSVSEGGAGREGVMNVGDRLVSVNDVSLVGKDRHATVDLVKQCSDIVHLKVFRLEALSSSLVTGIANKGVLNDQKKDNHSFSVSSKGTRSRTPPPSRKHPHVLKKRTRAISDFGAVGDTLPDLNSEDLLANLKSKTYTGYLRSESLSNERVEQRMDYDMTVASMYKFEDVDDDVTEHSVQHSAIVPYCVFKSHESGWLGSEKSDVDQQKSLFCDWRSVEEYRKKPNLDWADDLDDIVEPLPSNVSIVILHRNELGSLGFQIASSAGIVYVKQITAEPALSCPNISVGDKIIMVNHKRVENMAHQDVVDLIRKSGDKVAICLEHIDKEMIALDDDEQTIRVVLEKSTTGSLGLSLAKKTGYDGIYIRMISSGSAADIDGTLHIGDRIWKVNGDSVSSHTPGAIVDLLKAASNPVEIVVKRTINK